MGLKMTTKIKICMGSACFARGNSENIDLIEKYIKNNGLDAKIELIGSRCEGKCEFGPNIFIDDVCHNNMTAENVLKLLKGLKL